MFLFPQAAPPTPAAARVIPGLPVKAKVPVPCPSSPPGRTRVGPTKKVIHYTLLLYV